MKKVLLALIGLSFFGYCFVKSLVSEPHLFASTPASLELKNSSFFSTVYFLEHRNGELIFFWKEHMFKGSHQLFFEMESSIPTNGLTIATKIDGEWRFLISFLSSNEPNTLLINESEFSPDRDGAIRRAYSKYVLTELGNYSTNILGLLFLIAFVLTIRKV
ncbi:MAG: hypothetical protein ABJO02_14980 [Reichenbachiella sp.]|uniref:hypothetical protein n=1 Tax=Reichenbachiella sp. TaxID=2184521 RepID=UPI003299F112